MTALAKLLLKSDAFRAALIKLGWNPSANLGGPAPPPKPGDPP